VALFLWLERAGSEPALSVAAEVPAPFRAPVATARQAPPPADPPALRAETRVQKSPSKTQAQKPPGDDTTRCAELARRGSYDAAARCYEAIAQGSSMAAELALYEKARIESKALGRGSAALATFEQHAKRFPSGVLATEVGISRIELLIQLGQGPAALTAIDQALGGPPGRERGGDLQALRADLLAAEGECDAAREALELARAAGVHPSRLDSTTRRCSEAAKPAPDASTSTTNGPP
jgi:tetratricopeptide (TPR) repeat protein